MKTNRKFSLGLLVLVILFSCALVSQRVTSERDSVPADDLKFEKIRKSILCLMSNGRLVGRCFLVAPDKIATNIHVMADADPVSTHVRARYATWSIRGVTAYDVKNDLVILQISDKGVPLPLADSDTRQSDEAISVVEYSGVIEYKVTEGTVHSVRNTDKWIRMKIDAPRGTSGSAVLNSEGKVIGVIANGDFSYVYAAPSSALRALLARSKSVEPLAQWQKREQISAYRYCTQANQKYGAKRYEEAIVDLDKAIQLNPRFIDAYYGRATTKLSFGKSEVKLRNVKEAQVLYQEAIEDSDEVIKLNPEYADAYGARGASRIEFGKLEFYTGNIEGAIDLYAAAIRDYTQTIKLEPERFLAYYHRGLAKSYFGKSEYSRGNAKEAQDLYQGAIEDYTQAIKIEPAYANIYSSRGWVKLALGESEYANGNVKEAQDLYQGVIEDCAQAIKIDPEYAYAYNNRGWTMSLIGELEAAAGNVAEARRLYEVALIDVDKSIQLDSDNATAYRNRGAINATLGNPQDAITDFDKAIQIDSKYAEAYYERGRTKKALGQHEAAKADFDKAKELDPNVGQ